MKRIILSIAIMVSLVHGSKMKIAEQGMSAVDIRDQTDNAYTFDVKEKDLDLADLKSSFNCDLIRIISLLRFSSGVNAINSLDIGFAAQMIMNTSIESSFFLFLKIK